MAQIFSQIASITVKKLRNTNFISSRYVKRKNTSLPVDVRRSKTSLLKLPNDCVDDVDDDDDDDDDDDYDDSQGNYDAVTSITLY